MKPELLSPAQDFVSLKAAITSKADAIYFGIKELNMRIGAKNFELKDIKKVISQCHKNKVKAYFTLNTIIYDNEIKKLINNYGELLSINKKTTILGYIDFTETPISYIPNLISQKEPYDEIKKKLYMLHYKDLTEITSNLLKEYKNEFKNGDGMMSIFNSIMNAAG